MPRAESPYAESAILDIDESQLNLPSPSAVSTRDCLQSNSPLPPTQASQHNQQSPTPGTSAELQQDASEEQNLDEDILQLLGDAPITDTPMGPPIHKDIANRWQDILAKGLSKDVKDSLLKAYLVPSNCNLLLTPALNPEVKAALPDTMVKRDSSLMYKQKQLGIALSALATATKLIISNETSQPILLKPISDACRILCDSHFLDTKSRRNFVISSINNKLKDALLETQRDKLLFGENVAEKLKVAKNIQQSGEALKHTQRPKIIRGTVVPKPNRGRLNFTPQHRKTDNKLSEPRDTRRALRPAPRAQFGSISSRRPSPPPRPAARK